MRIVLAALLAASNGCTFSGPRVCALSISPAVVVEVRDARTGSFVATGAHGVVREGTYVDSLTPYTFGSSDPGSLQSLQAALGRTGIYSVEIERSGYQRWTISGIHVTRESCGVHTARLRASLIPIT